MKEKAVKETRKDYETGGFDHQEKNMEGDLNKKECRSIKEKAKKTYISSKCPVFKWRKHWNNNANPSKMIKQL